MIPYLSITTQTAKTFRDVLGLNSDSDVLLEHYSTAGMQRSADVADNASSEFEDAGEHQRKLAAERWDNRPRTTSEGLGEVSDVALKRKIRNRLQDAGESVFVQSDDRSDDGAKSLSDRFNTYLKTLPKDEQKQKNVVFGKVCERWLDVRSFGQVFAFKKAKDTDEVSIGVRGPVSIQPAFSINPIAIDDVQITKSVNSETTDSGKKSSDTMGMKYRVSGRAVYVTYGSISPQLAERTGFSAEDAEKIKEALVTLFENDESSARPSGSMEVLDVVWFAHNCKGGQYSSAKVHRSVSVDADGTVNVDDASIPGLRYEVIEGR